MRKYSALTILLLSSVSYLHTMNQILDRALAPVAEKTNPLAQYTNLIQPMTNHEKAIGTVVGLYASLKPLLPNSDANEQEYTCKICRGDCHQATHNKSVAKLYASIFLEEVYSGATAFLFWHHLFLQGQDKGFESVAAQLGINYLVGQGIKKCLNGKATQSRTKKEIGRVLSIPANFGLKQTVINSPFLNSKLAKKLVREPHKMRSVAKGTILGATSIPLKIGLSQVVTEDFDLKKESLKHSKHYYLLSLLPKGMGFALGAYLAAELLEDPLNDLSKALASSIKEYAPDIITKIVSLTK